MSGKVIFRGVLTATGTIFLFLGLQSILGQQLIDSYKWLLVIGGLALAIFANSISNKLLGG